MILIALCVNKRLPPLKCLVMFLFLTRESLGNKSKRSYLMEGKEEKTKKKCDKLIVFKYLFKTKSIFNATILQLQTSIS